MFHVAALIACVALLYATVGQAGGTAFLAIMAFAAFPADEMRPTALLLNIVAAGYATWPQSSGDPVGRRNPSSRGVFGGGFGSAARRIAQSVRSRFSSPAFALATMP
jgi:hypothetical protein